MSWVTRPPAGDRWRISNNSFSMCFRAKRERLATTMKSLKASWPFGSTKAARSLRPPLCLLSSALSSFFCWVSRSLSLAIISGSFCGELARGLPRAVAGRMALKALVPFNGGVGGVAKAFEPRAVGRESDTQPEDTRADGGAAPPMSNCKAGNGKSVRQLCFEIQRAAATSRWTRTQTDTLTQMRFRSTNRAPLMRCGPLPCE